MRAEPPPPRVGGGGSCARGMVTHPTPGTVWPPTQLQGLLGSSSWVEAGVSAGASTWTCFFMEWFHHCLKDTLRACCTSPDWLGYLPWGTLGLQAALQGQPCHIHPGCSEFALVLPGQLATDSELSLESVLNQIKQSWACVPEIFSNLACFLRVSEFFWWWR